MSWLVLRILLFALGSWSAFAISLGDHKASWLASGLVPVSFGAGLLLWIMAIGWRQEVDLTEPLSLTKPFWPVTSYPGRWWSLTACACLLGGGLAIAYDLVAGGRVSPMPVTVFAMGIAIGAVIWMAGKLIDKRYM